MLRREFVQSLVALAAEPLLLRPEAGKGQLPRLGLCIHLEELDDWSVELLDPLPGLPVRGDLFWSHSEHSRGRYRFVDFERALELLSPRQVRLLTILDYGNPLYASGKAPAGEEARRAFSAFAAAAAGRLGGLVSIWQVYNEPNLPHMWRGSTPHPSVYASLFDSVFEAIKRVTPEAHVIPAGMGANDWRFWMAASRSSAVGPWPVCALHPYRRDEPEGVELDLQHLLTATKQPPRLWFTEWGYSRRWRTDVDDASIAALLHRCYWAAALGGVEALYWYHFGTRNPQVAQSGLGFQLVDLQSNRSTAAWEAFIDLYRFTSVPSVITAHIEGTGWTRLTIRRAGAPRDLLVTLLRGGGRVSDVPRRSILQRWGDPRAFRATDEAIEAPSFGGAAIYHTA